MVVVSDGQKAAEFAAELQSVVPSDKAIPSDAQPVEILLVYSMDGGEHRYQLYRESNADYIAKDGVCLLYTSIHFPDLLHHLKQPGPP